MVKENILGFDVCCSDENDLIKEIFKDYVYNNQVVINSINPEIIINNIKDDDYKKNMNNQKYQIPDGIGIVYASKINKGHIKSRITGIDFMNRIIEESIIYDSKIFLYGSKPNIAFKAKQELEKKYKKINIVGVCDGYIDENEALEIIEKANPDILFVGLGSPKQERFILENMKKLKTIKIFMPVGGSFDVISNSIKRAPKWMINTNLEWFYRLIKQPTRVFRQLKLIKFILVVFKDKIKKVKE